jgi:hypothetical protein
MKRDDKRHRPVWMLEADMTAALTDRGPAELAESGDELGAGNDRQPLAHAGSGNLRRTIPISSDRPS